MSRRANTNYIVLHCRPRERGDPYAAASRLHAGVRRLASLLTSVVMGPCVRRDDEKQSPRPELLRQHEYLARARDFGPAAVEFGDQGFQRFPFHGAIERSLIGELVTRLMQRGIVHAPAPPRLVDAERLGGIGQMFPMIPRIERGSLGRAGSGGAADQLACRHGFTPRSFPPA